MSAHEPDSLAAARADVERTREELGNTVEALAYKADVKARAHDKVDEVKAQAAHKVDEVKAKAADSAEHARATAQETAVQAQTRVRQVPTAALAGAAAGLLVLAVVLWRRGSR